MFWRKFRKFIKRLNCFVKRVVGVALHSKRFLRRASKPNALRPVAKRGKAAGRRRFRNTASHPGSIIWTNDAAIQTQLTISVRTMSALNFSRGTYEALIEAASDPHRIFMPRQLFLSLAGIGACAMPVSPWDFDLDNDARDVLRPKSPEELADQFGTRTALLVLCIAFFIAAIWFVTSPSFEKCSAVANLTDRHACYDVLRQELLKPPAKGADVPKS
jgi:hypothetical protein